MTLEKQIRIMDEIFTKCIDTHEKGQKEYAGDSMDVYANFKRVAKQTNLDRMQVLMVYLLKHIDGIGNYVKGHETQREPIQGRIIDAIVYLTMLWGMIQEGKEWSERNPRDYYATKTPVPLFTEDPDGE
tara:strand:- start:2319 stop:2705 length:387 start_codon:yes stop_codon:yes gene_type:complete